jgi:two-component system, OmpR family, alkaline phosphatase synthesis response regulator PhoP
MLLAVVKFSAVARHAGRTKCSLCLLRSLPDFDMVHRILLVEDERGLRLTLRDRLTSEGYQVETAADGESGFRQASDGSFDLIVLDLMLPQKSGYDICRDLRALGFTVPVLILTARVDTVDKVVGLKLGADDYVTKPFEMVELLARVEALLRRTTRPMPSHSPDWRFGSIHIDLRKCVVFLRGKPVTLSAKEFQLLRYMVENRGITLTRDQLLHEVWGYTSTTLSRTVDVHIAWLRQKLEEDPKKPQWIITVHRVGYKFAG